MIHLFMPCANEAKNENATIIALYRDDLYPGETCRRDLADVIKQQLWFFAPGSAAVGKKDRFMSSETGYLIEEVLPHSPAAMAGVKAGDRLLRFDNRPISDIIDYKIMEADERARLLLLTKNGQLRRITIHKKLQTSLGLRFSPLTMAPLQQCRNRCVFCFVDQNPPGMRAALYLKDDDYRLSFLFGNFITLNRLTDNELSRIIRLQLSPLYVSVHATSPAVRNKLFGTARSDRGLKCLHSLLEAGIGVHAQVVLCPGYNTGAELKRTISDLARMGSGIKSVALVPVGVTMHGRGGDHPLRRISTDEAKVLVALVTRWQQSFLRSRGRRFLFLADEIYALAGAAYPEDSDYEDYPQLENGVGLARQFLNELSRVEVSDDGVLPAPLKIIAVTGMAAAPLVEQLKNIMERMPGLDFAVVPIANRCFGETVTVAGLLTGKDVQAGLQGKALGDVVFIPRSMLKNGSDLFLDDTTLAELEAALHIPVRAVSGPQELFELITGLIPDPEVWRKRGPRSV